MTLELIDTHCHLMSDAFDGSVDAAIDRAVAAGVRRMITVGTDAADSERAAALARRRREVWFAAGIHPHEAAKASSDDLATLKRLWQDPRCVAAGEVGLDYHYDFSPRDVQRDLFARQLDAALETKLPIIVHSREAFDDVLATLEQCGFVGRPLVFHCYSGNASEAVELASRGWRASFAGVVTFKKAQELQRIARDYPADRLMLETDAPYLTPEPVRHLRPNEPAFVTHTATFLATLRNEPPESLAAATTAAAAAFFRLQ